MFMGLVESYYEAKLVMAAAQYEYVEKELDHARKKINMLNARVDEMLDFISDLETKLESSEKAREAFRVVIEKHIRQSV